MKVEQLTCAIGAELTGVRLSDAVHDEGLFAEIRAALLKHRVLFLRNQDIARADHTAFARKFGELEDHPVVGSDPENPGLLQIYKTPESPPERYENAWHSDTTWREAPQWPITSWGMVRSFMVTRIMLRRAVSVALRMASAFSRALPSA